MSEALTDAKIRSLRKVMPDEVGARADLPATTMIALLDEVERWRSLMVREKWELLEKQCPRCGGPV